MNGWTADITNDPDDDYNLVMEISHNNDFIGKILGKNGNLMFQVYKTEKNISIPMDWLKKLFDDAYVELGMDKRS